jgi:hypothetical protein
LLHATGTTDPEAIALPIKERLEGILVYFDANDVSSNLAVFFILHVKSAFNL